MPFETFEHNGRTIFHNDLRGLTQLADQVAVLDAFEEAILATTGNVLVLTDVTDGKGGSEFLDAAKTLGKKYDHRVDKEAVVGATGLKKVLLHGYVLFTGHTSLKAFDNRDQALAWLTG